jgi:hypothetical protein
MGDTLEGKLITVLVYRSLEILLLSASSSLLGSLCSYIDDSVCGREISWKEQIGRKTFLLYGILAGIGDFTFLHGNRGLS